MDFMRLSFHHPLELRLPHTSCTAEHRFSSTKWEESRLTPAWNLTSSSSKGQRHTATPRVQTRCFCPSTDPKLLPSHTLLDPPAPPLHRSGASHANRGRQRRACGSSLPGQTHPATCRHAGQHSAGSQPGQGTGHLHKKSGQLCSAVTGMDSHCQFKATLLCLFQLKSHFRMCIPLLHSAKALISPRSIGTGKKK